MLSIRLGELARVINGRLIRGSPNQLIQKATYLTSDYLSHKIFFFPTRYLSSKFRLGELGYKKSLGVVTTPAYFRHIPTHHPLILVDHAEEALFRLARYERAKLRTLFIGITGSSGKTTTKDMLASILRQRYYTYRSIASYNVASVIPTHIFKLTPRHQVAVIEMGLGKLGGIAMQCSLAKPKIGVVTHIGEAHCGQIGNSIENVIKGKQEIIDGLMPGGFLVLNADDRRSRRLSTQQYRGKVVTFGIKEAATYTAKHVQYTKKGMRFYVHGYPFSLSVFGLHNVYNALAAIAVAKSLQVSNAQIQQGLYQYQAPPMRLQKMVGRGGSLILNDAYNANPTSMIEGLKVLKHLSTKRNSIAVLGSMKGLGSFTRQAYARVGQSIARHLHPDQLITIGKPGLVGYIAEIAIQNGYPKKQVHTFRNQNKAIRYLRHTIDNKSVLYFKASRADAFEYMVRTLKR
ncbi:UDP-N-acetylmuramoyl-tripeptide--D-alanyl-D-alanine ligase [Hazenella sp. IB182357]|uniref:UDP-N-acetylmuramoyl-tripeptide--D-alanyl-D-alanine ligase n=1 Tax=Polycladospora coralii TaxID=2771432 RepID=A0A926RTX2_9BACL|nr:UDP-N-acetylmuramoyl-tripeptide--D-alanyl-D-alanine ligase [Polycladospora coralii]MBD1371684.1 UDP-N-acetylmuramoyl-tripeptide--D-alanyl-D-alanine ligase [Polycladospora coralii]MBS7529151.1 UDP-N-acetylmuramoyl-tripeptide--D-alanyl-D-alanine ligase [Polycladospora coralii]